MEHVPQAAIYIAANVVFSKEEPLSKWRITAPLTVKEPEYE
jgi:hypothetical protein